MRTQLTLTQTRITGLGATLFLSLGLVACAPQDLGTPASEEDFLAAPTSEKGYSLRDIGFQSASLDGKTAAPLFLSGRVPAAISGLVEARDFVRTHLSKSFRLSPSSDFVPVSESRDEQGFRYLKLRQTHGGVPVSQGEVILQVAEDGAVLAVAGRPRAELNVRTTPGLAGEVALARSLAPEFGAATPKYKVHEAPRLEIYTEGEGSPVLAYRTVVEYVGPHGFAFDELVIDADRGAVLARLPRMHKALSRTIYDGKKACLKTGSELPGTELYKEGGTSADATANAAYANTGYTYWFYKNFLGRDSYDGAGATLKSSVHFTFYTGISCDGDNAAWLGAPYSQMVYGDGDGSMFTPLAQALDVTAHELTHAVTDVSSKLTYQNESGALNEGMSDIFGAVAEAWRASGGSSTGNPASITATANTWKIGEEITVPGSLPGNALRFMDNPTADGYSKDYYPERITGSSDNGGVHGNSGLANLAFYLLSQGGKHPRSKTTVSVTGIGIAKATQIFFKANTSLFTASTNFQGARTATAQAAKTLFGDCSAEWANTHRAWDAVGVGGTWTPCGTGDTTPPTATLTAPSAGSTLTGSVTISANATDNVGVTAVEFYVGTALVGTDTTSPYSISWDSKSVANGSVSITAKAKDAAGNTGTSSAVTATVSNTGGGGGTMNEAEPNNNFSQANAVATSGTEVTGYLSTSSDKDYYKVVLPLGKTLKATLTPPSTSDFDLYIYDNSQTNIGSSTRDVGLVDEVSATNTGTPVTYWVQVRYYSGASSTKPYKLKFTW